LLLQTGRPILRLLQRLVLLLMGAHEAPNPRPRLRRRPWTTKEMHQLAGWARHGMSRALAANAAG
jgi:hypothetical protein